MNTVTVEQLKSDPNLRAAWADKLVYIYSKEHGAYWRANGCGYVAPTYTTRITDEVGVFDFAQAWKLTAHCGPEKAIEFEEIKS